MVSSLGVLLATAIQSTAREMTKRIMTWFWDTRFRTNPYRLIPRAIFATEDVMATHTAMTEAPYHMHGGNHLLVHTTGIYLLHVDCLFMDMERENRIMHERLAASAQHN